MLRRGRKKKDSGGGLPEGYLECNWIQGVAGTGTVINTGLYASDDLGCKMVVDADTINTNYQPAGIYKFITLARQRVNVAALYWDGVSITNSNVYQATGKIDISTNYKNNRMCYYNGDIVTDNLETLTGTSPYPLYLFGMRYGGYSTGIRCYSAQCTRGDEVVRNYIACLDRNSVACMYDTINGTTNYPFAGVFLYELK